MNRFATRIVILVLAVAALTASFFVRWRAESNLVATEKQVIADGIAAAKFAAAHRDVITDVTIPRGGNFSGLLRSSSLDSTTAYAITEAVRSVFNPRRLRAGDKVTFTRRWDGELKAIHYRTGWDSELEVLKTSNGFHATEKKLTATTETVVIEGTIQSSLFESVLDAGEHPELAVRLAEIFAYDLDFYTDPQRGDTFRLVCEKRTVPGDEVPSYGQIFAAEYVNAQHPYSAVLFRDPGGHPAYYTADGKSLQKAFLRSPLKFAARVSSHFSRHRFHPVLKTYRAHLGTDYAAPIGTPVQAIANGKVEFSARKGGNGNLIILRHSNGYESYYLHLSQRLVRAGQNVQQGQRIGLVGMTGLASGPHLDFRLRRNGSFVDFERMKLPPSNPVTKKDMPAFAEVRDKWIAMLHQSPATKTQVASGATDSRPIAAD